MPDESIRVSTADSSNPTREVASDRVSGLDYQRVKLTKGDDGDQTPVTDSAPLPVYLGVGTAVIGKTDHTVTGIADGRKVVTSAGTRVALAVSTPAKSVVITAFLANTGVVVVGGTTVVASISTRTGVPLSAGDSVGLACDNLNDINIDATVNGEGVSFAYLT